MNQQQTAMQQALEALEQSETTIPYEGFGIKRREAEQKHAAAIVALRAALEPDSEEADDLYWRLHALSKVLEGSGRLDEMDNESLKPYATILDAMNAARVLARAQPQGWVLVPEQWTREMRHAFIHAAAQTVTGKETAGWEAALAARPKETT